ncbi:MAG: hypothetical protein AB1696_05125 [Planctomycetota bacterium]
MRSVVRQLSDPRYQLKPLKRAPGHGKIVQAIATDLTSKNGSLRLKDDKEKDAPARPSPEGEVCPKCGHLNERYALRCDACGAVIDAGGAPQPEPPPLESKREAEEPSPTPEASAVGPPPVETPQAEAPRPSPGLTLKSPPPKQVTPPPKAIVSEEFKLCDKCAAHVPAGSPTCPSCGALLRAARSEIAAHQAIGERYTGTVAIVLAIASMVLLRYGRPFALPASGLAILVGILAFRRDEQPGLGMLAVIVGILAIFGVIIAPMF